MKMVEQLISALLAIATDGHIDFKLIHGYKYTNADFNKILHDYRDTLKLGRCSECKDVTRECLFTLIDDIIMYDASVISQKMADLFRTLYHGNLNTLALAMTRFNCLVREKFGDGSWQLAKAKVLFRLTKEEAITRKLAYERSRITRNRKRTDVDCDDLVRKIKQCLDSKIIYDWIIAAGLICGGRLCEILSVSEFLTAGPRAIIVKGMAKERGRQRDQAKRAIMRPVNFVDSKQFMDLIYKIRTTLEPMFPDDVKTHRQKSLHVNSKVNRRVRLYFGDGFHFHKMRAIYGAVSFELANSQMSLPAWLASVLGHSPDNLSTSLSYSTIRLTNTEALKTYESRKRKLVDAQ